MKLNSIISNDIILELEEANDFEDVVYVLKKYHNYELKGSHLGRAFEKMFVSRNGFSQLIPMSELEKYHHSFHTTNGGDWCRSNQSYLGKKYNIIREKRGGSIFAVKMDGINKKNTINNSIRADILNSIQKQRCNILDIGTNIECDHKDGMKDDWRLNDKLSQNLEDFQPLSKTANDAKRQHCLQCKKNSRRYDAKRLGYSHSFTFGDFKSKTCVGCYWYDPIEFNKEISKDFIKFDK